MSILEFLSQPTWQRLALTLGHFLWQGLAVALLIAAVIRLGRFSTGNRRYTAYLIGFIIMLACPVVTFLVLDASAKSDPAAVFTPVDGDPIPHTPMVTPALPLEIMPITAYELPANTAPETAPPPPLPLRERLADYFRGSLPIAMAAWLVGVLALSTRLILGLAGVHRWRRRLEPLPERLSLRVTTLAERLGMGAFDRVFISLTAAQAVAVGYLRPMVLLPVAMLTQMPAEMLEAVIAHELAHIRRFDLYVNLIQRIAETLLFYHPALWWLSNRLRSERELCCDELAIRATGQRLTYASTLERAARNQLATQPATALALGRDRRSTLTRVRHILGLTPTPQNSRPWLAGLITVLLLAIFAASTVLLLSANAQSDDTDKALDRLENALAAFHKAIPKPDVLVETKNAEKVIWVVEDYGPTRLLSNTERLEVDWVSIIASVVKDNGYYFVPENGLSLKDLIRAAGYNKDKLAESYITVSREIKQGGQRAFKTYSRNLETLFSGKESDILLESGNAVTGGFVEPAPNAERWWGQYSFSDVVELTINDDGAKVDMFADLDTAKLITPPAALDNTDEKTLMTWITENGIDVMGETASSVHGLVGFNVDAARVDNYFWDVDKFQITDRLLRSMDEILLLSTDNVLPVTYLINTSEHTMGVLQILGFAKNPGGVNIRYKLLQKQDVVSKLVPHNTDSTVHQIAALLELWYEGCKTLTIETVRQTCARSYDLTVRDMREMMGLLGQGGDPAWTFGLLAMAWEDDDAIALSSPIRHSDPKVAPESVLLWTLKKENDRWGITDIDVSEAASLQIENLPFLKQHPSAATWFDDPDDHAPGATEVQQAVRGEGEEISQQTATIPPPGRYGLLFDGKDDLVEIPASDKLKLDVPFTIEVWLKPELPTKEAEYAEIWDILSKGFYTGKGKVEVTGFGLRLVRFPHEPPDLFLSVFTANAGAMTLSTDHGIRSSNASQSDWRHVAVAFDHEGYRVYGDAGGSATVERGYLGTAHDHPLIIGKYITPTGNSFNGHIGEIRIWNTARTEEEINRYRHIALTGQESELLACWTLEEGQGRFASDISSNKNHAHLGSASEKDDATPKWITANLGHKDPAAQVDNRVKTPPVASEDRPKIFTLSDKALMSLDVHDNSTARVLDKRDTPGPGVEFDIYFPPGGYSLTYISSRDRGEGTLTHIDLNKYIGYALKFTLIDAKNNSGDIPAKSKLYVGAKIGSPSHYLAPYIYLNEPAGPVTSSTAFDAANLQNFDRLGFTTYLSQKDISNTDGLTVTIKIEPTPGAEQIEPNKHDVPVEAEEMNVEESIAKALSQAGLDVSISQGSFRDKVATLDLDKHAVSNVPSFIQKPGVDLVWDHRSDTIKLRTHSGVRAWPMNHQSDPNKVAAEFIAMSREFTIDRLGLEKIYLSKNKINYFAVSSDQGNLYLIVTIKSKNRISPLPRGDKPSPILIWAFLPTDDPEPPSPETPPSPLVKDQQIGSTLEFRIAPDSEQPAYAQREAYLADLAANGPQTAPLNDDRFAWFPIRDGFPTNYLIAGTFQNRQYILLSNEPSGIMLNDDIWGLQKVEPKKDSFDNPAVAFEFDQTGTKLFAQLTAANIKRRLAILVDGTVYSAPTILSKIHGQGQISGTFTEQEVSNLTELLRTGMPPITVRAKGQMPGFDPTIEITINDEAAIRNNSLIDFDTGKLLSPPDGPPNKPIEDFKNWLKSNSIDASAATRQTVRGLNCYDMIFMQVDNSWWTNYSAHFLATFGLWEIGTPGFPTSMTAQGELPATYIFKTREAGGGILQIAGFTKFPHTVKIRYKMVQNP